MKKKKILLQTDFSSAKTGFGKFSKVVLEYLYKTGKYDLVHYVVGMPYSHPELSRTPWKSVGCLPDSKEEMEQLNKDGNVARMAGYGAHLLDKVIYDEKPDFYIAAQDIWGVDFAIGRKWFDQTNSVIWTTLDSMPILPTAVKAAKRTKNYWIWSDFATKELHRQGFKHVKTVHGPLDCSKFSRLMQYRKKELRAKHGIPENNFVIGFVFRNQLRKSVPNLIDGFKLFKKSNPNSKAKLLLHTHWSEGWRIHELADERGVDKNDILTTYICSSCLNYDVKPFTGQNLDCPHCHSQKTRVTTQPGLGVTDEQLNEVYNLMDVYCHPFTSGGQEIPIQEAKLAELITLVTNYSCGEEMCYDEACSYPLQYAEYREPDSQFIKASTDPKSIAKNLQTVFELKPEKKREMERKAREWTIKNFSIENIGRQLEEFFDNAPEVNYSWENKEEKRNPFFQIPEQPDNALWLKSMYSNILRMDVLDDDEGLKYWMDRLQEGMPRGQIEGTFREIAARENAVNEKSDFKDLLDKDDEGRRICFVIPRSIGDVFMATSLFRSLKETYPNYNLYVATEQTNFPILDGNPYVHKVIPYVPNLDNLLWSEGQGNNKGHFEITFLPHVGTQLVFDYQHNGKDIITHDLKYESN